VSASYLVDTNVISAFAPGKAKPSDALAKWMADQAAANRLFISAVVVTEILRGIVRLEHKNHTHRAASYRGWMGQLEAMFSEQIIPIDLEVARTAGMISGSAQMSGFDPGLADSLIAATAKVNDLTVLTRNARHFAPLGIRHLDPFLELPG
jgi:predicted nucleic acid-binding protein